MFVILTYMVVSDMNRNKAIYNAIEKILSRLDEGMPVAVIGDFNGHVGFLGEQSKNRKGENDVEIHGEMEYGNFEYG